MDSIWIPERNPSIRGRTKLILRKNQTMRNEDPAKVNGESKAAHDTTKNLRNYASFLVVVAASILSELGYLSLWMAAIMSLLGASLYKKNDITGVLLAVFFLSSMVLMQQAHNTSHSLLERITQIFLFQEGSRAYFCTLIYISSVAFIFTINRINNKHGKRV